MRRRAPIQRKTRLRGTAGLSRRTRLRAFNPERRQREFARAFGSRERVEWMQAQPCATCGAKPPSEVSHVRSRGAGGGPDDTIPQCRRCHRRLHALGIRTFGARFGVDLEQLVARYASNWRQRHMTTEKKTWPPTVLECGNMEPGGRMLVTAGPGEFLFIVRTDAIDALADAIARHCGSEGNGTPFRLDLRTGEVSGL